MDFIISYSKEESCSDADLSKVVDKVKKEGFRINSIEPLE